MNIRKSVSDEIDKLAFEYLSSMNYKINRQKGSFIQLLKFKHWKIEDKKRKVSFSKQFTIPEVYKDGLQNLIKKAESGKDGLFRHQSRGLFNGKSKDLMFCDFGIHHLHLGIKLDVKHSKMIEGTKDVVFAYINENEIFFIKIAEHGEWHLKESLEIIHKERPDLIQHKVEYMLEGEIFTDEEIKRLRDLGINYTLKIDNISYKPQSIYNTCGAIEAVIQHDFIIENITVKITNILSIISSQLNKKIEDIKTIEIEELNFSSFEKFNCTFIWDDISIKTTIDNFI